MCTRRSGTRCGVRVGNGTYAYRRYGGTACFARGNLDGMNGALRMTG